MIKFLLALAFSLTASASLNDVDKAYLVHKNIMDNGGFENGAARWTESAGTEVIVTSGSNLLTGKASATWDAAAANDTYSYNAVAIPNGLKGKNGLGYCSIQTPSGTATHKIQIYDGSNVLSEDDVVSSTSPVKASASFIFPSSGTVTLRLEAQADEPLIAIDDCYLGEADNLTEVSQAEHYGSITYAGATSCSWGLSNNNNFTNFAVDSDCATPTLVNNAADPGKIPGIRFPNMAPGHYLFKAEGTFIDSNASVSCSWRFSDGTNTTSPLGHFSATTNAYLPVLTGDLTYTTGGDRTIQLQATGVGGAAGCNVSATAATTSGFKISVYKFPTASQLAVKPDTTGSSWSGYFDSTCSFTNSGPTLDDPAADASCALVQRTNSGFGTVTAVAGILPQISILPKRAGVYNVCATLGVSSGTTIVATFRLLADSTTLGDIAVWQQAGSPTNASFCALANLSDVSAKVFKIQSATTGGTVAITAVAASTSAIEWTIYPVSQQLPAPLLVNSVVSKYAGVTGLESASLSVSGAVTREGGDWITGNCTNATPMVCTLEAGIFSDIPHCWTDVSDVASTSVCQTNAVSSTSVQIHCNNDSGSTSTTSVAKEIFCKGPR